MRAGIGLLLLAGCARHGVDRIELPPAPAGAMSLLVSLERDAEGSACGSVVGIQAIDLGAAAVPVLPFLEDWDGSAPLRLTALYYDRPLGDLGLTAGALVPPSGAPATGEACVPRFDAGFRRSARADWSPVDTIGECFCLPVNFACAEFHVDPLTIERDSVNGVLAGVVLDQDSALITVGATRNSVYRIHSDGRIDPIQHDPPAALYGALNATVARDPMYFGSTSGGVVRGHLDGDRLITTTVAQSPDRAEIGWLAGKLAPDGSLGILFLLTRRGAFLRYDARAGTWTHLDEFALQPGQDRQTAGALLMLGDDEAIAMNPELPLIMHAKGSTSARENVLDGTSAFCAASRVPGLGTVVGNGRGGFFASPDRGAHWEALPPSDFGLHARAILPATDGLYFGGNLGYVGQYLISRHSFCTPLELAPGNADVLLPLGRAILAGGARAPTRMELGMVILRP